MKIAIVGAGYVGLVSGACFADFGHDVVCVDSDPRRIEALNAGRMPIYEQGLERLLTRNIKDGRLAFTGDLELAVSAAQVVFIAVGTPARPDDGQADLSFVRDAAASIGRALDGFTVIVNKSTVPVGTGDEVERIVRQHRPDADFVVASNPEFLREGAAIDDFKRPDRIIIGIEDERAREVLEEVYHPLVVNGAPILFTRRRTAELTKYAANAFLAMKVTFINEIADLCEATGADVEEVARGMGLDTRIGPRFLSAGPGFGGSCFPKDTLALANTGRAFDAPQRLVETAIAANEARKLGIAGRIIAACGGSVAGCRVAMMGLTFKANTDDMRESPAIPVIEALVGAGAAVAAFDPEGMRAARALLPAIEYADSVDSAAENADCLVLMTEWDEFRSLDLERLRDSMRVPRLVDLRNIYERGWVEAAGFGYFPVGRP